MIIVYGPKPGTEVTFPLKVDRPTSLSLPGGSIPLPEIKGVDGNTVKITAKVPSDKDKRELRHLLNTTRVEVLEGNDKLLLQTSKQALDKYHDAVLTQLLVRLDEYQIADERPGIPPFEPHTPAEVIEFVDEHTKTAIVDTLMDRTRLSESLRGNSAGRSTSSTAATPALDGTAANAASSGSASSERAIAPPTSPTSTSRAQG